TDAAIDVAVPQPTNITIVAPAADVPPELARFSGKWCGAFDSTVPTILVVEAVTPPSATVVYGAAASDPGSGAPGVWYRTRAEFVGGVLTVRPIPGLVLTYVAEPDGTLTGAYGFEQPAGRATMVRAGEATPTGSMARAGTGPSAEFEGVWTTAF